MANPMAAVAPNENPIAIRSSEAAIAPWRVP